MMSDDRESRPVRYRHPNRFRRPPPVAKRVRKRMSEDDIRNAKRRKMFDNRG